MSCFSSKIRATSVLSVVIVGISVALAQQKVLPVRLHAQHTMVWCWAASAAMVIEYETGDPTEDCEVLAAYDTALGGAGMCCIDPSSCMRGGVPGEIENILGNIAGIHGTTQPYPASFDEVRAHLDTGHPLILWLWRTETSAHVVVVAGYRADGSLLVLDPMQGQVWVSYAVLRGNWMTGVWRHTIFIAGNGTVEPPIEVEPPQSPAAHWCCTPAGRFGPYLPNDVPVGATCYWPTPYGTAYGTACN